MGNSREKYIVFEAALQTVVYPMSKRYAASESVLTFVLAAGTYVIGTHHFCNYFSKEGVSEEKLIAASILYQVIILIAYYKLKLLYFLKNKECKKNERI